MKLNDINSLITGKTYTIYVIEDHPIYGEWHNEYIAEYRGLDIEEYYLLFWIEEHSSVTPFHFRDVTIIK